MNQQPPRGGPPGPNGPPRPPGPPPGRPPYGPPPWQDGPTQKINLPAAGGATAAGPRKILPIVLTLVIAAAGIVAVGGYFLTRDDPEVAQVALEPVAFAGSNPFTEPVGTDAPDVKTPVGAGGEFGGDTPGLYGDTGDTPSCDAQKLLTALQAEPAKGTAWAEALGLTAADVPAYVASLNPVVLRSDVAVTEHNFVGGTFSPYPAVLQAGTAVFVNSYGEPKVKCYSGNPLTRPLTTQQQVGYAGSPWPGFTPKQVTVIKRPTTVISQYVVVNVRTGGQKNVPGKPPGPGDGEGFCDRFPGDPKCKPTTTNPNNPLGPAPGKGCTASDKGWVCPVDFDPTKRPAPNCVQEGQMWSCPVVDPATPPAAGCAKAGPQPNAPWRCPGAVDTTMPPAAGCTNTPATGVWECPFPPNPDTLVGGRCTKMVVGNAQGSTFSQSCPQPFDVDRPPAADCNSRGEAIGTMVWECPITGGLALKPPDPSCKAEGGIWVCQQPFNPAASPGQGCLASGDRWICPGGPGTPPAPDCTRGDTTWMCPPVLDVAKKPPGDCRAQGATWFCTPTDPTTPPAANCTKTATGAWSCPPDPKTAPAANCTLGDTGWLCPPAPAPNGRGGLTPDQVMQVCTVTEGGCTDGKPTAEQQCAVLPMTCVDGVPKPPDPAPAQGQGAPPAQAVPRVLTAEQLEELCPTDGTALCVNGKPTAGQQCGAFPETCTNGVPNAPGAPGAPAQGGTDLTVDQINQICQPDNGPNRCPDRKPSPAQQCETFPATCTNGVPNAPAGPPAGGAQAANTGPTPEQVTAICTQTPADCENGALKVEVLCATFGCGGGKAPPPAGGMIVGPGMGQQTDTCMMMVETCPPGTPGAGPEAGAGGAQGEVPAEKPVGPAGPGPCPAVLPDPARPDCGAPAAPAAPPVDPGAGEGGAGQGGGEDGAGQGGGEDGGAGEGGGDTGGGEEDGGGEGGG